MKIVVTGVKGQLGHDIVNELKGRNYQNILGIDITDLDITNGADVQEFFTKNNPSVIIHCAAYTAVDKAEDEKEKCFKVNVDGTRNLIEMAKKYNSKIVYISTDYIFDGEKVGFYEVSDQPNPKSVYGESKFLGELETRKHHKHFIVRISWVFGKNGHNFVRTMIRLGKEREFLNVVNDQVGSPTYTKDLAGLIVDMIDTEKYGTYHATNEDQCTWYEFTKEIFGLTNIRIPVNPISSDQYPTKAVRPKNSLLSKKSLVDNGFKLLPSWKSALQRFLKEIEVVE